MFEKRIPLVLIVATTIFAPTIVEQIASADIVVTSRTSRSFFDVFAGVGSDTDRRRETPDPNETLQGGYFNDFDYEATAALDNGAITGSSRSEGSYIHQSSLAWSSSELNATYSDSLSGTTVQVDDGLGFVDMNSEFEIQFSLDSDMAFSFRGQIGASAGDTTRQFRLERELVPLFNFRESGLQSESGILEAGDYRLRIYSSGNDFNAEAPFSTSSSWNFQVGSVPEPGAAVVLGVLGAGILSRRRKV